MDWDELISIMRTAPMPPGEPFPQGVSEEAIEECEKRLGAKFPCSLRSWLHACNGPCVGPGGIVGISPGRKSQDIERILGNYPVWMRKSWFPVAGDGCGNFYLMSGKGAPADGETVFFIDCMVDPATPAYAVASNLPRFLLFLVQKELGQTAWPFDRSFLEEEDPELLQVTHIPLPWNA